MDRRTGLAVQYFDDIGLRFLTKPEIKGISGAYERDIKERLAGIPDASLRMTDTLLRRSQAALREGTRALGLEIGGTNLRVQTFSVENGVLIDGPGYRAEMPTVKFESADQFYAYVAREVKKAPGVSDERSNVLTGIYSFPGETEKSSHGGVDIISDEKLPKGWVIPGISRQPVGQALVAKFVSEDVLQGAVPAVILNDTPAVLLSHHSAKIGAVVGTGFNIAVDMNGIIRSSESGGFRYVPMPMYVQQADQISENPGRQYAEKQVGGKDVGREFSLITRALMDEGLLTGDLSPELTAIDVSDLLSYSNTSSLSENLRNGDSIDIGILREAAQRLATRSSQIVGVMVGTLVRIDAGIPFSTNVDVPVEGSFFWGATSNIFDAMEVANQVSARHITFNGASGIRGAADAALRLVA